jgi:hypothetical protein
MWNTTFGPFQGFASAPFGGFGGWPPGGGAPDDGAEPVAVYSEEGDGDISDDGSAPIDLGVLETGTTLITATQQGEPRDVDYVTFTVPEGMELSGLTVEGYVAEPGNLAFFGIEEGATFETDPNTQDASTLLGGVTYAHWAVGVDVLQIAGDLEGAQGFDGALGAGTYTLWLNQTGPTSTVSIGLEVTAVVDDVDGAPEMPGGGDRPGGFGPIPFADLLPDGFDFDGGAGAPVQGGAMMGGMTGMAGGGAPPAGDVPDLPDGWELPVAPPSGMFDELI